MKRQLATFPGNGKVDRKINTCKGEKVRQSDTRGLANWSQQRNCILIKTNVESGAGIRMVADFHSSGSGKQCLQN